MAFAFLVSLVTGVVFGLIPALQSSKTDLTTTLKESSGRSGTGFRQNKARSILVVTEVALALVLLIGSALLIRTAVALARVNPGFDATNVLTMRMSLTGPRFQSAQGVEQMIRNGVEQLKTLPGVVDASATCCVPLKAATACPSSSSGRPVAGAGAVPRRRRLDDGVAGLLRGLQDPGEARAHVRRARRRRVAAGGDHQRGDGEAVLGRRRIR